MTKKQQAQKAAQAKAAQDRYNRALRMLVKTACDIRTVHPNCLEEEN